MKRVKMKLEKKRKDNKITLYLRDYKNRKKIEFEQKTLRFNNNA